MARESTFCMESGQVKCGKDAEDTYINMLLANVRVTGPIAYGITARYPNVVRLHDGLEEKGPTALEHLKVGIYEPRNLAVGELTYIRNPQTKMDRWAIGTLVRPSVAGFTRCSQR